MMKQLFILLVTLIGISTATYGQGNNTCANAAPFCTGQVMNFPAGVNAGNAQPGPNYGCLGSQPNPAWFYMQIQNGGPLVITMSANQDIDFICWGPFPSLAGACGSLTAGNTQDCSYSGSNTETCTIANAIPGQFYLLLITNFSNQNQNITFQQINAGQPGAATTNCGIMCSMTVTGTGSVCSGKSATLSAIGGTNIVNINWTGPGGYSSNNIANPTVPTLTASGVYTALATTTGTNPNTNTCSVTHSINVVGNPTPVVNNSGPLCEGVTATLTAGGGGTYSWTGPLNFTSTQSAPTITNTPQLASGVYSVMVTLNTCTTVGTTTLQVKPNPTVSAIQTGSFCEFQSFNILASGANTYSWSGPGGYTSNFQNLAFNNNNLNMNGVYTVTGTINGCTASVSTTVTIHALPILTLTTSGDVCQNTPLTFNASGAVSYVWVGPNNFNSNLSSITTPSASLLLNGIYTVTGTDQFGCVNTSTISQKVWPTPIPVVSGAKVCFNESIKLAASGGTSYVWTGPMNYSTNVQNPIINNANYPNAGNYSVVITGPGNCTIGATVKVEVFTPPTISYSGNTAKCYGDAFSFNGLGGVTYKWLNRDGLLSNASTYSFSSTQMGFAETYTLIGFDLNGCASTVVITPQIYPLPVANLNPVKEGGCVPFNATYKLNKLSPNITFTGWSLDNGEVIFDSSVVKQTLTVPGIHRVKVDLTDDKGCKNAYTTTVEAYALPQPDFSFSNEHPTEMDNLVTFTDLTSNVPVVQWFWDFYSNDKDVSNKPNPTYSFPNNGNYFVKLRVTSDKGCMDSVIKKLSVEEDLTFYIPNSFTPNGDGLNDVFHPKAVGIKKFHMEIYDRWGEQLFVTDDIQQGWDGRSKKSSNIIENGVYVYKISVLQKEGTKTKEYTGHVTLLK